MMADYKKKSVVYQAMADIAKHQREQGLNFIRSYATPEPHNVNLNHLFTKEQKRLNRELGLHIINKQ